jgi:hypothetical protein
LIFCYPPATFAPLCCAKHNPNISKGLKVSTDKYHEHEHEHEWTEGQSEKNDSF